MEKQEKEISNQEVKQTVNQSIEPIISLKNLEVRFRDSGRNNFLKIIRGVDIEIMQGQIVGFVGESGSGKSVVSKTFLGLNDHSFAKADKAIIDEIDVVAKNNNINSSNAFWRKIRGKKVAYIPQDPLNSLNPTKKIGKQIVEAYVKNLGISKRKARRKAIETLATFKIPNARKLMKSFPHEFSGGMQQRVVIAIAVACNAKIIIADEPTTALDPTVQSNVLALLQRVNREFGITIIIISHDISVVAKMASYIYVFYAGLVVEKASVKGILTDPQHPYTWALLAAVPSGTKDEVLNEIPGTPPEFRNYPIGDPFASRNVYAQKIDFLKRPPLIKYKEDHWAATWFLHPASPKPELKPTLRKKLDLIKGDYNSQFEDQDTISDFPSQGF